MPFTSYIRIIFGLFFLMAGAGASSAATQSETATFAGGCFWCMDAEFSDVRGVTKVVSGFTGGHVPNPTYEQVSTGKTGHVESIQVTYDPAKVTFSQLVDIFWHNVDPTDEYGQFCDKGSQYRAGIFYHSEEQKKIAEASKARVKAILGQDVATVIEPASDFYPAEDYHQDYYIKNKSHYKMYRWGCGRDQRLSEVWRSKTTPISKP